MTEQHKLAVFDFDNTLIKGDSLWPFLTAVAGTAMTVRVLVQSLILYAFLRFQNKKLSALPEMRTFVKVYLLRKLLKGREAGSLGPSIEKVRRWCIWKHDVRQAVQNHFEQGYQIVIASGALNLYLPELLKDFPPHVLICTSVKIKDGLITGEMDSDNCVRQWKAQMLSDYMSRHEPFADSWGYGNLPHDLPMLSLLKHQIVIS